MNKLVTCRSDNPACLSQFFMREETRVLRKTLRLRPTELSPEQTHIFACLKAYQFANPIQYEIDYFLANSIVPTRVVIGCVLFASDQLLWVKELAVCACAHLICNR